MSAVLEDELAEEMTLTWQLYKTDFETYMHRFYIPCMSTTYFIITSLISKISENKYES